MKVEQRKLKPVFYAPNRNGIDSTLFFCEYSVIYRAGLQVCSRFCIVPKISMKHVWLPLAQFRWLPSAYWGLSKQNYFPIPLVARCLLIPENQNSVNHLLKEDKLFQKSFIVSTIIILQFYVQKQRNKHINLQFNVKHKE